MLWLLWQTTVLALDPSKLEDRAALLSNQLSGSNPIPPISGLPIVAPNLRQLLKKAEATGRDWRTDLNIPDPDDIDEIMGKMPSILRPLVRPTGDELEQNTKLLEHRAKILSSHPKAVQSTGIDIELFDESDRELFDSPSGSVPWSRVVNVIGESRIMDLEGGGTHFSLGRYHLSLISLD
jgi:hypothetical protein